SSHRSLLHRSAFRLLTSSLIVPNSAITPQRQPSVRRRRLINPRLICRVERTVVPARDQHAPVRERRGGRVKPLVFHTAAAEREAVRGPVEDLDAPPAATDDHAAARRGRDGVREFETRAVERRDELREPADRVVDFDALATAIPVALIRTAEYEYFPVTQPHRGMLIPTGQHLPRGAEGGAGRVINLHAA